jgi:O-succinylbenzoate synthase
VRKSDDPLAVARAGAADLLVIKAQPLGGVTHALQIVTAAGLPAVVSSALDTAIGLSQGAALAAALPTLDYDCGLGTASLFLDDIADRRPVDGYLPTERAVPDADALHRLAAADERREWWLARLARCHHELVAAG